MVPCKSTHLLPSPLPISKVDPIFLLGIYVGWILLASSMAAGLYAWDKSAAGKDRPRISERTLLLWSLVGGWPGAWLASRTLRHKTYKLSYRIRFLGCVSLHVAAVAGVVWWWNRS